MQMIWNENSIYLHGRVADRPVFSHSSHGGRYYVFPMSVLRLSGAEDGVNVIAAEDLLEQGAFDSGEEISVRGEVRSFNNKSGVGSRLIITVYAREVAFEQREDENHLTLSGTLCRPPIYRKTPLGRDICDMMLAVNRRYGRTDYLPCISWGGLAQRCKDLPVGGKIRLEGRLQSRAYTKREGENAQERTAFEVSVMEMELEESVLDAVPSGREALNT